MFNKQDILDFVENNDVRFIRLAFVDIDGRQKNISIMPDRLAAAFDVGISFDASAVDGFLNIEQSDLFLRPDPSTMCIVPWRSQDGMVIRMVADIYKPDGTEFEGSSRYILRKARDAAAVKGYTFNFGSECEFYLFENDERGKPTQIPLDEGGYFDVAPVDKGENIRREICLTLERMGIKPECSHHEQGPGQNEIDFRYGDVLETADHLITFKWVVSNVATASGLTADFSPKPLPDAAGNGLHVNMSVLKDGQNLFLTQSGAQGSFIAGIMRRIREISLFLNSTQASYRRLGEFEAPKFVTWSRENRSQLIRIPYALSQEARIELRSPDPACNPYLAFALLLHAGLEGLEEGLIPHPACNENMYESKGAYETLPTTLADAVELAASSQFVRKIVGNHVVDKYLRARS